MSEMPLDELRESVEQGQKDIAAGRLYTDKEIDLMLKQQIAAYYHLTDEEVATINLDFDEDGEDISQEEVEHDLDLVLRAFEQEEKEVTANLAVYRISTDHNEYGKVLEPLRKYILDRLPLFKRTEIIELLSEVDPDFYDGVVNIRLVEEL